MEFTRDKEKNEKDIEEDEENVTSTNPLYELMGVNDEDIYRDSSGLEEDSFLHQGEYSSYQNAAPFLEKSNVEPEVYRCVQDVDSFSQQKAAAIAGERHLDKPFELKLAKKKEVKFSPVPANVKRLLYTHFFVSSKSFEDIAHSLSGFLKHEMVDFVFDAVECEWKCKFYPSAPAVTVTFNVHANSCPQVGSSQFVLEFVKRSGDTMTFSDLFAKARNDFLGQKMLTLENGDICEDLSRIPTLLAGLSWSDSGTSLGSSSTSLPLIDDFDLEDDDEEEFDNEFSDSDLYTPIFDLAQSPLQDLHCQALALLACEAKKGVLRMHKAVPEILEIIVKHLIETKDMEVRRNCCSSLCSYASESSLRQKLLDTGAHVALIEVAAVDYDPLKVEVQRQAVSALENMCKTKSCASVVMQALEEKLPVFETLSQCGDQRLVDSIVAVQTLLG